MDCSHLSPIHAMLYFMHALLTVGTAILISLAQGIPIIGGGIDSCNARLDSYSPCYGTISSSGYCKVSILSLANTNVSACTSVRLFWSYPVGNLTMTIVTLFTQRQEAYKVSIDNEALNGAISHVYRLFNGEETEVTTNDNELVQDSDSNYQVIIKLQGPSQLTYYGVFINYKVMRML